MTRVCKNCGFYIERQLGVWVDLFTDELCYDDNLNLMGPHEPGGK